MEPWRKVVLAQGLELLTVNCVFFTGACSIRNIVIAHWAPFQPSVSFRFTTGSSATIEKGKTKGKPHEIMHGQPCIQSLSTSGNINHTYTFGMSSLKTNAGLHGYCGRISRAYP